MTKNFDRFDLPAVEGTAALKVSDLHSRDNDSYREYAQNENAEENFLLIDFADYSPKKASVLHDLFCEGKLYNGLKEQNLSGQPIDGVSRRDAFLAGLALTAFAFASVFFGV